MKIDTNLIGNILIALLLYNILIRAILSKVLQAILKSDTAKEKTKDFKAKLDEQSSE